MEGQPDPARHQPDHRAAGLARLGHRGGCRDGGAGGWVGGEREEGLGLRAGPPPAEYAPLGGGSDPRSGGAWGLTLFYFSIRMLGKAALVAWVHRVIGAPGPAAKLGAAVVGKGLVNLLLGVHHKRTVLRHRLANRAGLQHQQFTLGIAVDETAVMVGLYFHHGFDWHRFTRHG